MRVLPGIQGEPEWRQNRCGRITASSFDLVMSYLKRGGESQERANYRNELVAERLTGIPSEHYVTRWMKEGKDKEPEARTDYELHTGNFLDQYGFVLHPRFDYTGASPDGLLGTVGGAEFKAPKATTHIKYLDAGVVPEEYVLQMLWQMVCCELEWLDFVSFCPEMKEEELKRFIVRLPRDDAKIVQMEYEAAKFEQEIQDQVRRIRVRVSGKSFPAANGGVPNAALLESLHRSLDEDRSGLPEDSRG